MARAYVDVCAGFSKTELNNWAKRFKVKLKQIKYSPNGDLVYCLTANIRDLEKALSDHYMDNPKSEFIQSEICVN